MSTYEAKVATCETIIGHVFANKLLCLEALQTSGHALNWQRSSIQVEKNDRLAVFGDAVIKAHLCGKWLATRHSKGQWTQAEQALLSNTNLSATGFVHGLDTCVILNMGTKTVSQKTMATTVEAILGAVYKDGGDHALDTVLLALNVTHPFLEATRREGASCSLMDMTSSSVASEIPWNVKSCWGFQGKSAPCPLLKKLSKPLYSMGSYMRQNYQTASQDATKPLDAVVP